MDPSRSCGTILKGAKLSCELGIAMYKSSTAMQDSLLIEALITRDIGSDNTQLRTALAFMASLPAGRPAMTLGYPPTKQGMLQMTSAS
eukprot:9476468-Pyramimonas_sp.AAC.1